ncbi:hypothetical protein A2U01_0099943, partial [Trifolium medium]|nr:hypothetical protein [Trifolium medium]
GKMALALILEASVLHLGGGVRKRIDFLDFSRSYHGHGQG